MRVCTLGTPTSTTKNPLSKTKKNAGEGGGRGAGFGGLFLLPTLSKPRAQKKNTLKISLKIPAVPAMRESKGTTREEEGVQYGERLVEEEGGGGGGNGGGA